MWSSLLIAILLFSGCALVKDTFTNPTGNITIPRQQFINTYAYLKVLTKGLLEDAHQACAGNLWPASTCLKLQDTERELKILDLNIQAKIEVPESEIDWEVVIGIIKGLASLRP